MRGNEPGGYVADELARWRKPGLAERTRRARDRLFAAADPAMTPAVTAEVKRRKVLFAELAQTSTVVHGSDWTPEAAALESVADDLESGRWGG